MSKINTTKEEVTAIIDSAISILNRFPDLESSNSTLSYGTSVNPFTLLMDLFKSTSGYNNLIKIIAKFISKSLPTVESAVKTLLTAKLKDIISCSVNPFLTDEILRNGVIFNIKEIDLVNTFRYSPFDEEIGQYYYFGVFENETYVDEDTGQTKERSVPILPDDLIKCDDMNALLWYMINRANKRYVWKPEKYRHGDEFRPDYPFDIGGYNRQSDANKERMETIYYTEPLQELTEAFESGEITEEEFNAKKIELDSKWEYFKANFSQKLKKEDGIVTFEFKERNIDLVDAYGKKYMQQTPYNNVLHVFIGDVREKETDDIVEMKNAENEKAKNEKRQKVFEKQISNKEKQIEDLKDERIKLNEKLAREELNNKEYAEQLKKLNKKDRRLKNELNVLMLAQEKVYAAKHRFENEIAEVKNTLDEKKDQYFPFANSDKHRNYYYGKTLIEFNIDYIWSLKLFDAKSLTARLLDALTGMLTIDLKMSYEQQLVREEVSKMVRMITESDDLVVSDCFFSFSNADYDMMSRKAELRRAGLLTFNGNETSAVKVNAEEILSKINEIDDKASEEKIESVIEGSLIDISKQLTNTEYKINDKVNFGVQMDFIENIMNSLAYTLVMSVLSPKVYLLLLLNLKIIGRESNFNLEEFLGQYKQLIADIIRSIRDQLLNYLQQELMILISDLVKALTVKLSLEQAKYYARLIKQLIDAFKLLKRKRKQNTNIDFNIDDVDYADILDDEEQESKNNNC